ncbi:MAG: hypothetical protein Q8O62_03625 [Aequorivita sp.]|nr:hypothetical protein [Aequorivita sp.]
MKDNMNTVLVFKTSVSGNADVKQLKPLLNGLTQSNDSWNFDLEDCDNILRVETRAVQSEKITRLLQRQGFHCEELF